jgi:hypothetical protein
MRPMVGGPACPRCRGSLAPADSGVELATLDAPSPRTKAAPVEPWVLEADAFELRRLRRKLRPCVRPEAACGEATGTPISIAAEPIEQPQSTSAEHAVVESTPDVIRDRRGGAASVAADSGFAAMILAAGTLGLQLEGVVGEEFTRWGWIGLGIGAFVFALGVLRLATHAWRQSRALADEVDALRSELAALRAMAASNAAQPRPSLVGATGATSHATHVSASNFKSRVA